MKQREPSYTAVGIATLFSHCSEAEWQFLKNLKVELPCDSAIPVPSIYPNKTKTLVHKDTCTPIFKAALLRIAKNLRGHQLMNE